MGNKKVCVVIPTLNEEEYIGDLIESLLTNSYKNKEVIVIDDGSTDRTVEIAREKNVTVLINDPWRRGPAYSRNRGAKNTDAEILCFLDADIIIEDPDFLEIGARFIDENTTTVYTSYKTLQDTLIEKILFKKEGISSFPTFIRKDIFFRVEGFPEIGVGEDVIFTQKLKDYVKKNNMNEKIVTETFFSGHGVHSVGEMYKQAKWYGKTSLSFASILKKDGKMLHIFMFYSRMIYSLSFLALFFIPISKIFWLTSIPFFTILFKIILKSFKNKYAIGKSVLFLLFGLGMLHGLILTLFKIDTGMGGR